MNYRHPHLSLIVAMTENRVIGRNNSLPWKQREDMRRFVNVTRGKPVIMGRKTYESLGKPLEGRQMIVLSKSCAVSLDVLPVKSPSHAIEVAGAWNEAVVIGGEQIYKLFLPLVETIHLTEIHADLAGDAFFPELKNEEWSIVSQSTHGHDAHNLYPTTFSVLRRTWNP